MSGKDYSTLRLDHSDSRVVATIEAEKRLFEHYGFDYQARFVDLDDPGIRVRVFDIGASSSPPVLFVPGGIGPATMYVPLVAELRRAGLDMRFIMVDRPGSGLSDYVDHRQVDFRKFAVRVLSTVLDAFGLESLPVVCNSMGGLWSFWLALDHPQRVTRMVQFGCPALLFDTSAPLFMRLIVLPGIGGFVASQIAPKAPDKATAGLKMMGSRPDQIAKLPQEAGVVEYQYGQLPAFRDAWRSLLQSVATLGGGKPHVQLREAELRKVRQPVLFIWGDNDPFGGLDVARQAVAVMPDARLEEVRAGHLPFYDEPAESARLMKDFLLLNSL
jgi:pimeloyl-ACP methyl ester carboxylesterase